jgi:hypothetical protein
MSGSRNALLGDWFQPPDDPQANVLLRQTPLAPRPSYADAADQAWAAIQAKLEEQQRISQERGLWTGGQAWEGGHPTVKGVADAAQQVASNFEGGIKAFHGSPHSFGRFDASKIGTGEGAQAYGHGLYFAENEGVARSYRDQLRGDPAIDGKPVDWGNPAEHAAAVVAGYNGSRAAAVRDLAGQVASLRNQKGWNEASDPTAAALRYLQAGHELPPVTQPPGHMYEVNINADPERMLHWDKPLSEQHPDVQKALGYTPRPSHEEQTALLARLREQGVPPEQMHLHPDYKAMEARLDAAHTVNGAQISPDAPGGEVYRYFGEGDPAKAAAALREAGIPGIRYLDQNSRTPRPPINLVGGKPYDPSDPSHGAAMAATWTNGDRNAAAAQLDKLALSSESAPQMRAAADYLRGDRPVLPLTQGEPPGTHNIVMFDANTIDILRKYGIAGLGIGLGAAATQGGE